VVLKEQAREEEIVKIVTSIYESESSGDDE
jgi:hypothetical protein